MTWDDDAACRRTARPDAWFELEEAADADSAPNLEAVYYAQEHCARCPVREACLERGNASRSPGIWGGELAVDRGVQYGSGRWWRERGSVALERRAEGELS